MILHKIAMRNVRQHKSKTILIGSIIGLGIFFLIVGNSLLDTIQKGMEKMYIENYTGDLFLHAPSDKTVSLFGAIMSMDVDEMSTEPIEDTAKLISFLEDHKDVESYSPQISGFSMLSFVDENDEQAGQGVTIAWGVDPQQYRSVFTGNIDIHDGSFLSGEKPEIVLSKTAAATLEEEIGRTIKPGDKLLLTGMMTSAGTKIREVSVAGIFSFHESNMQLDMVSLLDPETARAITGISSGKISPAVLTESEQDMLGSLAEEDLFSSDLFSSPVLIEEETDFSSLFQDDAGRETGMQEETPGWHFIIVKLKDGAGEAVFLKDLYNFAAEEGIEVSSSGWRNGAGMVAEMSFGIQTVFNIIILIIAVVAVIIIMNTLVISITERTPEIGTIRAIGGQRGFVRGMIVWETLIISGIFGLAGIVLGTIVLGILNGVGIEASNMFLQVIFGGETLRPVISLQALITAFAVVAGIGIISSLYPVRVALKIQPVQAMRRK